MININSKAEIAVGFPSNRLSKLSRNQYHFLSHALHIRVRKCQLPKVPLHSFKICDWLEVSSLKNFHIEKIGSIVTMKFSSYLDKQRLHTALQKCLKKLLESSYSLISRVNPTVREPGKTYAVTWPAAAEIKGRIFHIALGCYPGFLSVVGEVVVMEVKFI